MQIPPGFISLNDRRQRLAAGFNLLNNLKQLSFFLRRDFGPQPSEVHSPHLLQGCSELAVKYLPLVAEHRPNLEDCHRVVCRRIGIHRFQSCDLGIKSAAYAASRLNLNE